MPPKSRQTTLFSHFSSRDADAGPSRARSTRNTKPLFDPSDSEGSEGLDHVKMRDPKPNIDNLTMTQRRALKQTVYDPEDEDENENFEEEEEVAETRSPRKRGTTRTQGKSKRKHKSECSDTDPDEEFISYPLTGYLHPNYRGTRSQKVARRNDRLEAVEIQRASKRADILTDDEIEVFPSPPSPKRGRGRTGKVQNRNDNEKGKGKGKAVSRVDEEEQEDDIVPIDPPIPTSQRPTRAGASKLSQTAKPPSSTSSVVRPTKSGGRGRLPLHRTRSEVIVEIPRMSQEEKRSYLPFSPSGSSQSIGHSTSNVLQKNGSKPTFQIPSRAKKAVLSRESSKSRSLPPILENELPEDGLNNERDRDDTSLKSRTKSKSRSPVKPVLKAKELQQVEDRLSTPKAAPATSAAWIQQFEPDLVRQPSPAKETSKALSSKRSSASPIKDNSSVHQPSKEAGPSSKGKKPSPATDPPVQVRVEPSTSFEDDIVPRRKLDKGKDKADSDSSSDEEDFMPVKRPKKPAKVTYAVKSSHPKHRATDKDATGKGKSKSKSKRIIDPDDDNGAETEEEDNMLDELQMDEPERFKSSTRLRKRPTETVHQRKLRKLKNKRLGIVESSTDEDHSSSNESDPTTSDDDGSSSSDGNELSFIVPDDATAVRAQLPHEFSSDSAQTPEFKFKVVFHYLVMLVMKGKKTFPLSHESATYFKPQLTQFRNRMDSYRDLRVASQIWRLHFKKALKKYPIFDVEELLDAEPGCDACHMGGRMSRFRVNLEGDQYNPETHQPLDSSSEESESSDSDSSGSEAKKRKKLPKSLLMGRFCKQRAELYHQMAHWEDTLYHRIRRYYRDLLRAKYKPVQSDSELSTPESEMDSGDDQEEVKTRKKDRRLRRQATEARCARLRKQGLPKDVKDVDEVTEWMDGLGYQNRVSRLDLSQV
uniref:DUF4211 domain-containing protein n=1 Tax=Kwoniella dejecticola CBS 10117 TaxID=1296121 RepID=A0A1A6AFX4_9TREE|nr:uncharacterized protein I303_00746 [Kwoniella dejecticola CBS 10117]OBR88928.1 hypothetical protein I303_00746 [Kwoniella dejecticola CBS 10117]